VVGIISLGFWWIVTICGLLMLVRWLPSRGKHASEGFQDSWSEGPGLSILAHVGMLVGVCIFTFAYLTSAV
jgi:amino acid permease